ncbi:MAG TPA: TonB-dependent receptor [Prolixibacteraceae bacterium]|nr:TonB-dependent receptor [Prolixibacteraceae bacterium]
MKEKIYRENKPLAFSKWSNKGFAVFSSLKKVVKISTLAVAYLLFANPNSVSAQSVDTSSVSRNYDLESIDVTSEQLPETYSNISRVVVTITQKEIERAAVTSVNELLEYAANIDIRQRGTNGVQADISMRGGTFDQVLVLLNGVNITDPQTGHHNLNLPVHLSSIKKIEILKGPGAWKFGPGAFNGAINIITEVADKPYINAEVYAGQFHLHGQQIGTGFKYKNSRHLISASRSQSNGYTDNTDYLQKSVFYHGLLNFKTSELNVQAAALDKNFGANNFYSASYPNQFESLQNYLLSVSYKAQIKTVQFEPKIYYRRNNDRFLLFRYNPELYSNYHTTNVYGANLLLSIIHGTKGVTSLGGDYRDESIYSNNLGELSENTRLSPVNDTIILNRHHSRANFSMLIGHKRYFNKLMLNVGLNFTHNSDIEKRWFLYPGFDMNYQISPRSSVLASVNRTMRMPTFTDLYYSGPNNEGNKNLLPEMATGFEVGYKYRRPAINFTASAFYTQGENMIDWVRETVIDKWRTINYTNLNTLGFELVIESDLSQLFKNQYVFKNVKINYTNIKQQKIESELISNYSLNYLKHRVNFNLRHVVWKSFEANWQVVYQLRNGEFEQFIEKTSVGMVTYSPFITTDLKLMWKKADLTVYAKVNNLFNIEYYDFGNIVQPRRWVQVGIAMKMNCSK